MDFGVVGLDGLLGSDSGFAPLTSYPETKQKLYGSGVIKQERSVTTEDDWRSLKVAKTDDFSASKAMLLQQRSPLLRSNNNSLFTDAQQQPQQMLSFSSPKSETLLLRNDSGVMDRNSQTGTLPYFHQTSSAYSRNTVYNSGSLLNAGNMHGVLTTVRGPFTPSQWVELEHQALIYKYITANVPIPSNLLIPIRKALDSAGFSGFSGGPFRHNTLGWGSFHLGFSNNTDPEPGRCRRTDGKKWRCSRDAVADQKYCERHMNRGRHRSRKPVEGQTGHSVAATTTTTTTTKLMPIASSSSSASVVVPGDCGQSNGIAIMHHQVKNLQPGASNLSSAATHINRIYMSKENVSERKQDTGGLSMLAPSINLNSKENTFSIPKQQSPYEESPRTGFGLVSSDSFHNPSHKCSSFMNCRNFGSSQDLNDREAESQHSLRHFIDDWPKNQADRSAMSWPDIDVQSDRTQLSISIPMAPSDFMSSTSSPTTEKVALSPLRLSRELDPIPMGLGVGSVLNEQNHRQANWIPISWETSMGGPLGEVLHKNNNNAADCKNSSALNLMTEGWDSSPRLASSPTGVLQKTTFGSLSNSSAGSSPRAENKTHEGASMCNDLLGSTLVNSSSVPSL